MHIALYSPNWPPAGAANGIVSYVSTIRDHFISEGHRVSILSGGLLHSSDGRTTALLPSIDQLNWVGRLRRRIVRLVDRWHGGLPSVGVLIAREVQAAHRIDPIDIFEMEESFGWSHTVQRITGIPVVTRLHGPHFLKPPKSQTALDKLNDLQRCHTEGRAVRWSHTLTAPTRAMMNIICENYQRPLQERDAIIPNPIRMPPESELWNLASCERKHILMIGRFDYWKGADTMLLAFERLLRDHPDARLTLVGPLIGIETVSGQIADFAEYARKNLAPETTKRVELTGTLSQSDIADLRRRALVTVLASRIENFPYALLEGLASGSPMISTDWPGSNEIIRHNETGFLTPIGDPEALAQRLKWVIDNPEAAAQVGDNGRRHCAANFAVDAVGARLIACYEATVRYGTE